MSNEGEVVGLRMAKASKEDLDNITTLCGMIEDAAKGYFPRDANNEWPDGDPGDFNIDDPEHCQVFARRVLGVSRGIGRVVWGACCMLNPENKLIDPDKDYLDFHPRVKAGWKLLDEQEAASGQH